MPTPWVALIIVLSVMTVVLAVLVLGLVRKVDELAGGRRPAAPFPSGGGPTIGARPPTVDGLDDLLPPVAKPVPRVVVFLSSTCGVCLKLVDDLLTQQNRASGRWPTGLDLVLVSDPALAEPLAGLGSAVITQKDGAVSKQWGIPGTPFAVAIGGDGNVSATSFTVNLEQLRDFARGFKAIN